MSNQQAVNQVIQGMYKILTNYFKKYSTVIYDGIIISSNNNGRWNVQYNGEIHAIKPYKTIPNVGDMVKVIIPNGNQNLSFFI